MPHPKIFLPERNGGLLRGVLAPVLPAKKATDPLFCSLDFVTECTGFCDKTHWILQQNALDFATKRTGFCNKTHWILRQNVLDFANPAMSHVFNVHLWLLFGNIQRCRAAWDIVEVAATPANPWAWASLAADVGCIFIPGATVGGLDKYAVMT